MSLKKLQLSTLSLCLNLTYSVVMAEGVDTDVLFNNEKVEQRITKDGNVETLVKLQQVDVVGGNEMEDFGYMVIDATSATKTNTPLMQIPQSIQVIPQTVLVDQDLQTISDAVENVSSIVAPKTTELLTSEFVIRGFKSQFYLDSMPAFGQANIADPLSLVNVERIEVVKGPTATLFGGGLGAPIGGLINVVSKKPLPDEKYTVSLRGGSFETINPSFDLNQPLTEDKSVLFRVTGEYEHAESFIDEIENEHYSIFPTLSVDFSPDTNLIIRGQYSKVKFLEYSGLRAEGTIAHAPYKIDRFRYLGASNTPKSTVENKMLTAVFSHRFSPHVEASIQARYYENSFHEFSSFTHRLLINNLGSFGQKSPSHLPFYSGRLPASVEEFVINPNIVLDFDTRFITHKVLVGAEYDSTKHQARIGTFFDEFEDVFLDVSDLNDSIIYLPIEDGNVIQSKDDQYETIGVYIQDQFDITDRFHFLASVRWTHVNIKETGSDISNSSFTPRLGMVADITDEISAFIGYGEGFRAVTALFGATPKPEESNQIEGGIKFDFNNLGLSGTVAGYQLIRENVVVPNPQGAFSSIQAGEQTSYGAELDFLWEPTDSLSILGNYAYTEAHLTKHSKPSLGVGDRLPRVPKHSGRAAVRYRFIGGLFDKLGVGAGVTLASSRHLSLPNKYTVGGFYRIDAQASYPLTKNVQLSVNVQNLTNTKYYEPFLFLEDEVVSPGAPISAFATIKVSF